MHLRVRYHRASDLANDDRAQLSRGGLLVRVEPDESLEQFADVKLELVAGGASVVVDAQVLQVFPGTGVAVRFDNTDTLTAWVTRARAATAGEPDADPEHSIVVAAPRSVAAFSGTSEADRVNLALRGNRDERAAILRENNPSLHTHVLRNPGLQLDEVTAIAKMRTVSPELLKLISERREWATRPEIALALVRNPKTPVNIAVKLLDHVAVQDLRQLAKDQHTRTPIQQAARKRVVG